MIGAHNMEHITKDNIAGNKNIALNFEGMVRKDSTLSVYTK